MGRMEKIIPKTKNNSKIVIAIILVLTLIVAVFAFLNSDNIIQKKEI